MKCPYETLVKSGWVFKDICKVDFKQYGGLCYKKPMRLLLAEVDLPEDDRLPILGHTLLPLLSTSVIDHEGKHFFFFVAELVLNGARSLVLALG